jgi:nucleoid-associated protein YgaU
MSLVAGMEDGSGAPEKQPREASASPEPTPPTANEGAAPSEPEPPKTPAEGLPAQPGEAPPVEVEPAGDQPRDETPREAPQEEPGTRRSRAWLWGGLVLVAAVIVGLIIGGSLGGRQQGPLSSQGAGTGRPTIVVGTVAVVAPSAVPSVASPSAVPSTVVAGATAVTASTEYVVKPGDTLQRIAEQHYGDAGQWPRIYQANRALIGADPDNLVAGTTLQLPPP